MKTLKFAKDLVPLVLSGEKNSTWRLWDDKGLSANDVVSFVDFETKREFAQAKLVKVIEKPLGALTDEDKKGHESFESDEEMFKTYKKYYGRNVDENTPVKIIWFQLLEN